MGIEQKRAFMILAPNPECISIPARTGSLDARGVFKPDHEEDARRLRYVSPGFKEYFYGKVENPEEAHCLHLYRVTYEVESEKVPGEVSGPLLVSLGDLEYFLFWEPSIRPKGEPVLSHFNFFYIPDKDGVVRLVDLRMGPNGWCLRAMPEKNPKNPIIIPTSSHFFIPCLK